MTLIRDVRGLDRLAEAPRRLLAVFPHPDDEAYGCAGALARAGADRDTAAVLFCLTRGEASSMGPARGLSRAEVGDLRAGRLEEVAGIVGLDALLIGGFPDGRLARVPVEEVGGALAEAVRRFRPQVVIGHDPRGVNGHADHIASHWALRHALSAAPEVRFAMLAYPDEVCEAAKPRLLFPTAADEIDAVVRLSPEEIDRKEECLRVHEAIATLKPTAGDGKLAIRPPVECYDFLGEDRDPPLDDLFSQL